MRFTTKIAGDKADKSLLENAWKNGIPVEGHVEKEIKGGFEVKIGDSRAFCPYSIIVYRLFYPFNQNRYFRYFFVH